MKNTNLLKIVETAILIAIIAVMSFTPIGSLKIGVLEMSLLTIPVVIGAEIIGPLSGLVLGTAFGISSFLQCFGMSPFGTALFAISPFLTFLMCVPTRALMGWLTGVIFRAIYKMDKTRTVSYFAAALLGALLNTVFFMSVLVICFYQTDYIQALAESLAASNVLIFIITFVGLQGLIEMVLTGAVGGGAAKTLARVIKKTSDGEYV